MASKNVPKKEDRGRKRRKTNKAVNKIKQGKLITKNLENFLMASCMQKEIPPSNQSQDLAISNGILPNKRKTIPQLLKSTEFSKFDAKKDPQAAKFILVSFILVIHAWQG